MLEIKLKSKFNLFDIYLKWIRVWDKVFYSCTSRGVKEIIKDNERDPTIKNDIKRILENNEVELIR